MYVIFVDQEMHTFLDEIVKQMNKCTERFNRGIVWKCVLIQDWTMVRCVYNVITTRR